MGIYSEFSGRVKPGGERKREGSLTGLVKRESVANCSPPGFTKLIPIKFNTDIQARPPGAGAIANKVDARQAKASCVEIVGFNGRCKMSIINIEMKHYEIDSSSQ